MIQQKFYEKIMKKSYYLKGLAIAGLLCLVQGCVLMPGMSPIQNDKYAGPQNTGSDINPTIVPITISLIKQLAPSLNPYEYHVGIGDQVNIFVWGHPEFSSPVGQSPQEQQSVVLSGGVGQAAQGSQTLSGVASLNSLTTAPVATGYIVNSNGDIIFPLLGPIKVVGLSELQISEILAKKLAVYVKKPQVTVQVLAFNSQKVYVIGEVNQTTAIIPINETPTTLAYALSAVGGINQTTADASQVYVIRGSLEHPTIYWLDAENPASMLYADNFALQNHDVIFVSAAMVVRWNRILNQILPSVQTYYFTKQITTP